MWRPSSPGGGHLASGVCSPLQLPQAEGLPHVTSTFCPLSQGQGGDGHDGQYHCSRLSSPSGLLSVQPADGTLTIHPDIQLPEQDHPDSQAHQRGTERPGRSRIPVVSHPYGVVPGSSVFQLATRPRQQILSAQASSGPVCHPTQYPSEKLRLPSPGPSGSQGERPSLDWNVWSSIYLFPPVMLLNRLLPLQWRFRGQGILVAPFHAKAAWFPTLAARYPQALQLHAWIL